MRELWEKTCSLFRTWMISFRTVLIVLTVLYLCVEIGQLFFDGCFTPSCSAATNAWENALLDFLIVMALEVIFILLLPLVLPVLYGAAKLAYYICISGMTILFAIIALVVVVGGIAFVYMVFRDFGFFGGIMALGGVAFVFMVFGASAKLYGNNVSDQQRLYDDHLHKLNNPNE